MIVPLESTVAEANSHKPTNRRSATLRDGCKPGVTKQQANATLAVVARRFCWRSSR